MSGGGPTPSTWAGAAQSRRLTGAAQSRRRFWGVSWTEAGGVCRGGPSRRLRPSATRLVRACTGPSSDTGPSRSRLQGPATVKTAAAAAAPRLDLETAPGAASRAGKHRGRPLTTAVFSGFVGKGPAPRDAGKGPAIS